MGLINRLFGRNKLPSSLLPPLVFEVTENQALFEMLRGDSVSRQRFLQNSWLAVVLLRINEGHMIGISLGHASLETSFKVPKVPYYLDGLIIRVNDKLNAKRLFDDCIEIFKGLCEGCSSGAILEDDFFILFNARFKILKQYIQYNCTIQPLIRNNVSVDLAT